ncbi:MAG TPA: hypothetical protein VFZ58_02640 [Candidatus Saccharimonadales bacterium]
MPSPFTEATLEGWPQTFEEFVFAAAQLLAYSDHPLEEIAPNDHYRQELEQAWQRLTMLEQLNDDAWNDRATLSTNKGCRGIRPNFRTLPRNGQELRRA